MIGVNLEYSRHYEQRKKSDSKPTTSGNTLKIVDVIKFGSTNMSHYKILQNLGRGTYGEVSKYVHIKSGLPVAIKTFYLDVFLSMLMIVFRTTRMALTQPQ